MADMQKTIKQLVLSENMTPKEILAIIEKRHGSFSHAYRVAEEALEEFTTKYKVELRAPMWRCEKCRSANFDGDALCIFCSSPRPTPRALDKCPHCDGAGIFQTFLGEYACQLCAGAGTCQ